MSIEQQAVAGPAADGRHRRSQSSRQRIVAALLELVAAGDVSPAAARVAETAGVGLRTVFRHFDDMDALYREMSETIEARVLPITLAPFQSADWREQLREMADRRATLFENILPYRISASIKRFQSPFLMQRYRRMLQLERSALEEVLPERVRADAVRTSALNLALGFQSWRQLRHDEQLSIDDARAVVRRLVEDVIAGIPD